MAYMRGNPYVYKSRSGLCVSTGGDHITLEPIIFDALALMRVCELLEDPEHFKKVWEEVESHGGNFGADAVMKLGGGPTAMDTLKVLLTQIAPSRKDDYEVCGTCGTFLQLKESK